MTNRTNDYLIQWQLVCTCLCCSVGCSFQDLSRLTAGSTSSQGGTTHAGQDSGGSGGVVETSSGGTDPLSTSGGGVAGALDTTQADSLAGSAGTGTAGTGVTGGGAAGVAGSGGGLHGGASGVAGTTGSILTCPPGAAGCPGAVCSPGYADCNGIASDGCEVDLNSVRQCGKSCSDMVGCAVDQTCNAGKCSVAQGFVKLSMPFTEAGQKQRYASKFVTVPNLTNAILNMRFYAPGATGGAVNIYVLDQDFTFGTGTVVPLPALASGWTDVPLSIGPSYGSFDPTYTYQVTFEFQSEPGPWPSVTVVYVDDIRSSNGAVNDHFSMSSDPMLVSASMVHTGSTMTWIDHLP